ncbi:hypothetical protein ACLB90_09025 [Stenotrophomonas sp. LGBM10]|uniref:hypothetical protein n=1 Tax=Stenotrophomonas sp. LGBM10 TaxID=3390038 RepID=UPI00398BA1F5
MEYRHERQEKRAVADVCYQLRRASRGPAHLHVLLDTRRGLDDCFAAAKDRPHVSIKAAGYGTAALLLMTLDATAEDLLQLSVERFRYARLNQRRSQVTAWIVSPLPVAPSASLIRQLLSQEQRLGSRNAAEMFDARSIPHWQHAMSQHQQSAIARSTQTFASLDFNGDLSWLEFRLRDDAAAKAALPAPFNHERVTLVNETLRALREFGTTGTDLDEAHRLADSILRDAGRNNLLDQVILLAHALVLECDFHRSPEVRTLLARTPETEAGLAHALAVLGQNELQRIKASLTIAAGSC